MDIEAIKELVELVNTTNVGEIKIKEGDFKISIRHKDYHPKGTVQNVVTSPQPNPIFTTAQAPVATSAPVAINAIEEKKEATPVSGDSSNYITVKSPMIGTFYRSSSPEEPPFVKVGDTIKKGDVIGIIEAMKLFNDIESEYDGTIVKVLVDNAASIEYDQGLFLIDPSK
ncbi:MAG: acetyl-CoA carboxylase biotin carboxyl carrier protein [Chitinophagales bacterium]|nr:acetyl-CoA carboxylase biotin carboxyl carrier protein [Chitinophagales bacterium]